MLVMMRLACFCAMTVFSSAALSEVEYRGFDLELGPYYSSVSYDEFDGISLDSSLTGVTAKYSAYQPYSVTLVHLSYASGDAEYKGAGKMSNVNNEIYDLKASFGRLFYLSGGYRLTPFVGLGYRRSTMDSRGKTSTTGVTGYKGQQTYFYNPIGVEIQELASDTPWVIGLRLEYDSLLYSRNETRLGAAKSYQSVKVTQRRGGGYRAYLNFRRFLNEDGSGIVIEPFYKYFDVSSSDDKALPNGTGEHSFSEWGVAFMISF